MPKDPILHVLDVQEELNGEVFYVAQCLEFDICGIGTTIEEARALFVGKLNSLKRRAVLEGMDSPFAGMRPAPKRFWDLFRSFKREGGDVEQPYW